MALSSEDIAVGDALSDYAAKNWGVYLAIGILTVLFGFVVMSFKFATVVGFSIFAGIALIGVGVAEIGATFRAARWNWLYLVAGVLSVAAGILSLAWPGVTVLVLAVFIGWALLFWGIADIVHSVTQRTMHYWWLHLIRGIVSVGLGILALRHPGNTIEVLLDVIGIWSVIWGTLEIIAAIEMKGARRRWDAAKAALG